MGFWAWLRGRKTDAQQPVDVDLKPQAQALCQVLKELIDLLDADGETHWRNWLAESLTDLEANNLRGARHLQGAYGGMGSFSDLIVGQQMNEDGFEWAPGAAEANDKLDALRSEAYTLAKALLNTP